MISVIYLLDSVGLSLSNNNFAFADILSSLRNFSLISLHFRLPGIRRVVWQRGRHLPRAYRPPLRAGHRKAPSERGKTAR